METEVNNRKCDFDTIDDLKELVHQFRDSYSNHDKGF